jgi:hypothetical protein
MFVIEGSGMMERTLAPYLEVLGSSHRLETSYMIEVLCVCCLSLQVNAGGKIVPMLN